MDRSVFTMKVLYDVSSVQSESRSRGRMNFVLCCKVLEVCSSLRYKTILNYFRFSNTFSTKQMTSKLIKVYFRGYHIHIHIFFKKKFSEKLEIVKARQNCSPLPNSKREYKRIAGERNFILNDTSS